MLEARGPTLFKAPPLAREERFALSVDGEAVGEIVYDTLAEAATIALRGATYQAARARPRDEASVRALLRLFVGRPKPPPNPLRLSDAKGRVVAEALRLGRNYGVRVGDGPFELRVGSVLANRYDLFGGEPACALGSIRVRMLPPALIAAFVPAVPEWAQAFLLATILDDIITHRGGAG